MISIKNVIKKYDDKNVIKFSDKKFGKGISYINWKSGIGKTTLLKCVANIEEYDGEIITDGSLRYMQQENIILPWLTAKENILYGNDPSKKEFKKIINVLGLSKILNKLPKELSGGQLRRMYLANIILISASNYLLDEPFTGTDQTTTNNILNFLKVERKSSTILIATHNTDNKKSKYS